MNACRYCGGPASRLVCQDKECRRRYNVDRANERRAKNADAGVLCHCGDPVQAQGLCDRHYKSQRRSEVGRLEKPRTYECAACGEPVIKTGSRYAGEKRRPVCSTMCRTFLTWGHWPSQPWKPPRKPKPPRPAPRSYECPECGKMFETTKTRRRYCSRSCKDAQKGRRRRAAVNASAPIAPVYRKHIFERDKWTCQLCGKRLSRSAEVPHPLAPTIDHVIPLAIGGTHEPANCQAAHFRCNSIKGDRGGGEQLALVG